MLEPNEVINKTAATLSCNLTNPASIVKGHYWTRNGKKIEDTESDLGIVYTEYTYVSSIPSKLLFKPSLDPPHCIPG